MHRPAEDSNLTQQAKEGPVQKSFISTEPVIHLPSQFSRPNKRTSTFEVERETADRPIDDPLLNTADEGASGEMNNLLQEAEGLAYLGVGVNRIEVGSSDGVPESYATICSPTS